MDFSEIIKIGTSDRKSEIVEYKNTASACGSGGLEVYATPAMIALMEGAALAAMGRLLPPGWTTVGTELEVKHLSATPLGMKVYASAELLAIDGRSLSFKVEAFDEAGKIGEGTHKRYIVESEKFLAKLENKKEDAAKRL